MIICSEGLCVSELLSKDRDELIAELKNEDALQKKALFCIFLAENKANLLDILSTAELIFPYYRRRELYAVGIAESLETAKELAAEIVAGVYRTTGTFDIKSYYF